MKYIQSIVRKPMANLDHLSWGEINAIAQLGKARDYFALGATKHDYMKDGFVAEYQIIGFDHDDLADDSGKAKLTWDMVGVYKIMPMQKDNDSVWWEYTDVRQFLNNEFVNKVSDGLLKVAKPVFKKSADRDGAELYTKDLFWLKSVQELYGRKFYSYGNEGQWYEYYKQENAPYSKKDVEGDNRFHWLRSVFADSLYRFCVVYPLGSAGNSDAGNSYGIAPCFCI